MNRPIAILLIVLTIVGLLFSTFALFHGKFVEALLKGVEKYSNETSFQ